MNIDRLNRRIVLKKTVEAFRSYCLFSKSIIGSCYEYENDKELRRSLDDHVDLIINEVSDKIASEQRCKADLDIVEIFTMNKVFYSNFFKYQHQYFPRKFRLTKTNSKIFLKDLIKFEEIDYFKNENYGFSFLHKSSDLFISKKEYDKISSICQLTKSEWLFYNERNDVFFVVKCKERKKKAFK